MKKSPCPQSITEGDTTVFVFRKENESVKGPGKKIGYAFYNPAMSLNRDTSVLMVQHLCNNRSNSVLVLDGMAASGIRGFRLVNEVEGSLCVTINDWDDKSFELMKKNASAFGSDSFHLSQENIQVLLAQNSFDYVDIDPFGSPAVYVDGALRSLRNNGILAVSATDTATLCGVYPRVCMRRYDARPLHGPCMHETALRILIGFISRQAGKFDKGVEPVFCYSTDHYLRCYLRIKKGVAASNKTIEQIYQIPSSSVPFHMDNKSFIGPLWMGQLHDKQVVISLLQLCHEKKLQNSNQIFHLLSICEQEAMMPVFYYSTTRLSKQWKKSPPSLDEMIAAVQDQGCFVTKTQFDPTGFKTNADKGLVDEIFLSMSK